MTALGYASVETVRVLLRETWFLSALSEACMWPPGPQPRDEISNTGRPDRGSQYPAHGNAMGTPFKMNTPRQGHPSVLVSCQMRRLDEDAHDGLDVVGYTTKALPWAASRMPPCRGVIPPMGILWMMAAVPPIWIEVKSGAPQGHFN